MDKIKNLEKILKGLGNRRRLAIVKFLRERGEANVGTIAKEIKLSFKSTSRHLAILRQLDIADTRRSRLNIYYHLDPAIPKAAQEIIANFL